MRARTNFLIDVSALAVYLVATNPAATGTPTHEWLSIGFALVAFVHLVLHWDWTVHVAQRVARRLGTASRVNFAVDVALLIVGVGVVASGLAVSKSVLAPLGHVVSETSPWHAIHSQSSTAMLALMGLHLGLHWTWLLSTLRHQVIAPLRKLPAAHRPQTSTLARMHEKAGKTAPVRGWRHPVGNTVAAALVVAVVAAGLFGAVRATGGHVLPTWFALPGSEGRATSTNAAVSSARPEPPAATTKATAESAQGFSGTTAQRIAVRTGHSLVVVVAALLVGLAVRGFIRTG